MRDFALVHGNGWFQIPLAVLVGSVLMIDALTAPAPWTEDRYRALMFDADGEAGRWRMFTRIGAA